jgi:hypothetical protein
MPRTHACKFGPATLEQGLYVYSYTLNRTPIPPDPNPYSHTLGIGVPHAKQDPNPSRPLSLGPQRSPCAQLLPLYASLPSSSRACLLAATRAQRAIAIATEGPAVFGGGWRLW